MSAGKDSLFCNGPLERVLLVTVSLALPLSKVEESYADAIDSGYTETLNDWIKEYAEGIASDMERAERRAVVDQSEWRLARVEELTAE